MQAPEQPTPDPIQQAIDCCCQAFWEIRNKLPKNADCHTNNQNCDAACAAYLAKLPILSDPASFQIYVACIAHGAALGIIDRVDVGRFCHLAQTAMSAWKLANLAVPAEARKKEKAATPLPSKGNQTTYTENPSMEQAIQQALATLPRFDVQKAHFQLLRSRGILLPSDPELRDNPLAALHFCQMAEKILRREALAGTPSQPEPGAEPAPDPQEAQQQAA